MNWRRLLEGEVFERLFPVPSFQRIIDFRIHLEKQIETDVVFVMEPAFFLLGLLGDEIVVTYGRDDAALRRYEGLSNIRDESGDNYDVRVEFPGAREG